MPIIVRIVNDSILIDMRTVMEENIKLLADELKQVLGEIE